MLGHPACYNDGKYTKGIGRITTVIIHESLETPVRYRPDVLVVGGGFAGISAALAAARLGRRVLLAERMFVLGGLGTAGLVTIYLPICDGMGRQVSFGLAEELLRLSVAEHFDGKRGADWLRYPSRDRATRAAGHRFEVNFNPQLFAIAAEQALIAAGVEILYGVNAVAVQTEGDRITSVMAEGKGGRFAVIPGMVVDASGDCDIAHLAGLPTEQYALGNRLAAWYYHTGKNGYNLKMMGMVDLTDEERNANPHADLSTSTFSALTAEELSEMTRLSHASILRDVREQKKNDPTWEPVTIATIPQIRMTRRLIGAYTLDEHEVHTPMTDSVGMVADWRRRGPVFEVPYGTLYTPSCANLAVAGRCTSVTDGMWDVMRVIPCCSVTGQAAGTAAAMAEDLRTLAVPVLQKRLTESGVVLHESDLAED